VDLLGHGKILYGSVGSGKSLTALQYYIEAETPTPLFVITTAKKRDSLEWLREASKLGIGTLESLTSTPRKMQQETQSSSTEMLSQSNECTLTRAESLMGEQRSTETAQTASGPTPAQTIISSYHHGILTIDSWNNIDAYVEAENCFFIFDEQRLVGNGAWVKAF
jgi:hypothetical protein